HYFTEYGSATGQWCSKANISTEGVVPYTTSTALVSALDATNAPDFVELVPNDCDEMHGDTNTGSPCATSTQSDLISSGDTWLSNNLPSVLSSSWFAQDGIVIITWDEAASGDNSGCCGLSTPGGHIPTIVVSANNKGLGQFTGIGDHYGTLAAIEDAYGVPLLLNAANSANGNLSGAFGTPSTTGTISGAVTDASTKAGIVSATVTYSGSGGTASTTTTNGGAYSFANVPAGPYTVSASATGYMGQTSSTQTVTAGGSVTQNFALARILSVVESFGAANSGATGTTTLTATTATPTGSGDLLAVAIRTRGASAAPTVSGISDNSSGLNTWKRATGVAGKSDADGEIWYATDAASVTSITATVTGTASLAMTVLDISGASATPLDQVMTDTGTGTTATTLNTAVTAQANEIAVADIGWNGATNTYPLGGATSGYVSASTAFWQSTVTSEQTGEEADWLVLDATGAQSFSATLKASVAWTGVIATFG
ncbi:MAG: carboxypeptidase regulatory-like domain-containing protein, partial [Candidatus Dormibacteria bacterium]